jgi:hypothetical protein
MRLLRLLVLVLALTRPIAAQIVVSPTRVILANRETSRELTIRNDGSEPIEVDVRVYFGLWGCDSIGTSTLDTVGTTATQALSCHTWAKIFPRHFTLDPQTFQRVRLLVSPPADLSDGEYLARLLVTSQRVALPRTGNSDAAATAITTQLSTRLNQSFAIIYRKGAVSTGLRIDSALCMRRDTSSMLLVDISPLGNAAYRGTITALLVSEPDGAPVDSVALPFVAETPLRLRLLTRSLAHGSYRLNLSCGAVLPGSAAESVLPCPPVARSYSVTSSGAGVDVVPRTP